MLENIPKDLKQKMRKVRNRTTKNGGDEFADEREDDEVFIAEAILKRNKTKYLVKCVGYEAEWMEMDIIPAFLLEHFQKTGRTNIPLPRILSSSTTGNIVYNTLTWKSDCNLPTWTPETASLFPGHNTEESTTSEQIDGPLRCNTRKDKDSRFHRHSAGIFIG